MRRPAANPVIALEDLAGLPLRADSPPLHDLLMAACRDAGFEPVPGAPFTGRQVLVEPDPLNP